VIAFASSSRSGHSALVPRNAKKTADYRVRRDDLPKSVHESEGFSVVDALREHVNWDHPRPWLRLLETMNDSQRAVVAVAQVHEDAAFNGIKFAVQHHGREVISMAAEGATRLRQPAMTEMLTAALQRRPDWKALEYRWDQEAGFDLEWFIEENADDFFVS